MFGEQTFQGVIKAEWGHREIGSHWPSLTGILIVRGNQDPARQRDDYSRSLGGDGICMPGGRPPRVTSPADAMISRTRGDMHLVFDSPSGGCVMQALKLRHQQPSTQADLPPLALYGARRQPCDLPPATRGHALNL